MLDLQVIFDDDRAPGIATRPASVYALLPRGYLVPDDLPADWRIDYEEEIAIRTIQYGQALEHAEAEALTVTVRRMRAAGEIPQKITDKGLHGA